MMPKINLMIEFFDSKKEFRNKEIIDSIKENYFCGSINQITIFCSLENHNTLLELLDRSQIDINRGINIVINRPLFRMTYADYFLYTNNNYEEDTTYIIANNDICFDRSVENLRNIEEDTFVFVCLTRWNPVHFAGVNSLELQEHPEHSHDSWAFKTKIPEKMIENSFFTQGVMCCDNHIAYIALINNFKLINPCRLVLSVHNDTTVKKYDMADREIHNVMLFACVAPTMSLEYDSNKIQPHILVGGTNGEEFIKSCKETSLFLERHLKKYNMLKIAEPNKEHKVKRVTK